MPVIRPRWVLRCLTLRGISMLRSVLAVPAVELRRLVVLTLAGAALDLFLFGEEALELGVGFLDQRSRLFDDVVGRAVDLRGLAGGTATTATRAHDATLRALARGLADGHRRFLLDLVLGRRLVGEDLTLVDPHLHTDATERGLGLGVAVVDVGAQRVQRDATFAVPLLARHLCATEAAAALHADALGAGLHRGLHRALHGATEGDAAGELVGDTLRDEGGVELGLLDLLDVEVDLRVARDLEQPGAQAVGLRTTTADHDARTRGVHVDAETVARALDLDPAHRGALELTLEVVADLPVLDEAVAVLRVLGEPPRLPVGGDAQAEPVRVDLLSHYFEPFSPASVLPSSAESSSDSSSAGSSSSDASGASSASAVVTSSVSSTSVSVSTSSTSSTSSSSISSSCSWS